jgi:hypothetical protein
MSENCQDPNHDHEKGQDLMEVIAELETTEEIAGLAIQIFCAMATTAVNLEMPNPFFHRAFEPYKALAEKLGIQEITDLVITTEMEHTSAIELMASQLRHPAFRKKRGKK